jgi:hypothetical protein
VIPVLPERAPSEGPRSTAAVKSSSRPCLVDVEMEKRYEWTRAVEDQSAPIPEERTSELGRIICNLVRRPYVDQHGCPSTGGNRENTFYTSRSLAHHSLLDR